MVQDPHSYMKEGVQSGENHTLNTDFNGRSKSAQVWMEGVSEFKAPGVIYHDVDGRITDADDNAQLILGLTLKKLKGRKLSDPVWQASLVNGEMLRAEESPPEVALLTGKTLSDVVLKITHPETQSHRWVLLTAIPLSLSENAPPSKVITHIRDITKDRQSSDRVSAQMALMQQFWGLFEVSEIAMGSEKDVLDGIMSFLPKIFAYPDITNARILMRNKVYTTDAFSETDHSQMQTIQCEGETIGHVAFFYESVHSLDLASVKLSNDVLLMEALAKWLALVYQIREKNAEIERLKEETIAAYDRTIEAWSAALDTRDQEISGHTRRVTKLALELAKEMGVTEEEELMNIRRGVMLHDIGKLSIPEEIILKPGKLTEEEYDIVKAHPVFAQKWLSQIEFLKPALQIPYYYHENWDGSGYPQGLSGEQIPFTARMFAVADVWDVLISDRPYRPALSKEEALDIIISEKGSHFDPKVVESFLKVLARGNYINSDHEMIIKGFGQSRVWIHNRRITSKEWQAYATRDLFFLFMAHSEGLTKDQVGLHLWPDLSNEELDVRLKNTLYRLRKAVGKNVVVLDDLGYRFNKTLDYFYDVETFVTRIKRAEETEDLQEKIAHLLKAVQQYDGDYLSEIDGIWVLPDRERYRLMYLDALQHLAEMYNSLGETESALRYCSMALKEDPVFEEAHRLAMKIHAKEGNRAEIIRQYESCLAAFRENFDFPPSQQTQDLYETLIQG